MANHSVEYYLQFPLPYLLVLRDAFFMRGSKLQSIIDEAIRQKQSESAFIPTTINTRVMTEGEFKLVKLISKQKREAKIKKEKQKQCSCT